MLLQIGLECTGFIDGIDITADGHSPAILDIVVHITGARGIHGLLLPDGDTCILLVTDDAPLLDLIISDLVTGDIGVYTKNNVEKDNREDYHPYIELKWSSVFSCRFYLLFNGHCELWIKARSLHPSSRCQEAHRHPSIRSVRRLPCTYRRDPLSA